MDYFTPFTVPIFYEECNIPSKDSLIKSLSYLVRNDKNKLKQVNNIQRYKFSTDFISTITEKYNNIFYGSLQNSRNSTPILITSWYNQYDAGGDIPTHSHKNSYWSGVYYPYGNEDSPIVFENPIEQSMIICPEYDEQNNFTYQTFKVSCKKETIIFFPSYLRHYTLPSTSTKHSISFNFFVEGSLSIETKSSFNIKIIG